jgi:hypothetical protein
MQESLTDLGTYVVLVAFAGHACHLSVSSLLVCYIPVGTMASENSKRNRSKSEGKILSGRKCSASGEPPVRGRRHP